MEKLKSEITSVVISDATFKKNSPIIHPTFIIFLATMVQGNLLLLKL